MSFVDFLGLVFIFFPSLRLFPDPLEESTSVWLLSTNTGEKGPSGSNAASQSSGSRDCTSLALTG